jgi:hypothetical protein
MLIYLIFAVAFALAGVYVPAPKLLRYGFFVIAGFILLLALLALAGYVDGYPLVRSTRL